MPRTFHICARLISLALAAPLCASPAAAETTAEATIALSYGPRPAYLVDALPDGALKTKLQSCARQTPERSDFSIAHRGAPLMFPEHTVEGNRAAATMGAGVMECDVTFTSDLELVCRHSQNDLHTTTDILTTDLADRCTQPFAPATADAPASAECRTSDLTLAELMTLRPKMDSRDPTATSAAAFQGGLAPWRSSLHQNGATLLSHADSIRLFRDLGAKFTPELKAPTVAMPFNGMTQAAYAQKLIDAYVSAEIPASDVWVQSFDLDDIKYWLTQTPEFGRQAVYLDDRFARHDEDEGQIDPMDPATFRPSMQELKDMGLNYIAPPIWMLLTLEDGRMVPSPYAKAARAAGLNIITWTLERSGPLKNGGGWYFQSVAAAVQSDAATYQVLDVLAQDVGVVGVFSDWPATVTYYANCMGL
ncbi:glycerophosphodiester phosphodiesterase [Phaeobacter sp. HS012]|uniref:glycerophosphodiester phosphodiesterase family protein n=1 Tax=unclassified Phaeobacter TaxID=2621772 RepID=UPI001B363BAB|nr:MULTISPECIES: glycerophosphodiester phosphodiesterase family protein [unclassified Phaeobacter]MBQ4807202.1 glycerophosphodiester phosphodiesterase [Phaeobacter sp. HS012]MBQ4882134.1 glycerophosphodiester phosphodiesterase [Phaeobacter sp. HS011]